MQGNRRTFAATPRKRLTLALVAQTGVQIRTHGRLSGRTQASREKVNLSVVTLQLQVNLCLRAPSDLRELREREIDWCAIARPFQRFHPTKSGAAPIPEVPWLSCHLPRETE